jgi:hypothetical protein
MGAVERLIDCEAGVLKKKKDGNHPKCDKLIVWFVSIFFVERNQRKKKGKRRIARQSKIKKQLHNK